MGNEKVSKIIDAWKAKDIQTREDLSAAMGDKAITLAYHTNRLEYQGITYHDTEDVFRQNRVNDFTGDTRIVFAIKDAKNAWNLFLDSFNDMRPIDEALVKEFHFELTLGTYAGERYRHGERPGEYKIGDYVTGRYEVGAPPEDVPMEMGELLGELEDVPSDKVMVAAAYFHVKFENIHGFADGNGRTGRLLMNYFLACNDHPLIIIHEEDRKGYMSALEAWDFNQNLDPMKDFLEEQLIKTWG